MSRQQRIENGKINSAYINYRKTAYQKVKSYLKDNHNVSFHGLKMRDAVIMFAKYHNLTVVGNWRAWIIDLYLSGTNENVVRNSKVKTPKRTKQEKNLDALAKKARKLKRYPDFLQSKYWREVRKLVLKRDNYQCRVCKSEHSLEVHHDSYKHHFQEHKHLEDLVTLCHSCHTEWHFYIKQ